MNMMYCVYIYIIFICILYRLIQIYEQNDKYPFLIHQGPPPSAQPIPTRGILMVDSGEGSVAQPEGICFRRFPGSRQFRPIESETGTVAVQPCQWTLKSLHKARAQLSVEAEPLGFLPFSTSFCFTTGFGRLQAAQAPWSWAAIELHKKASVSLPCHRPCHCHLFFNLRRALDSNRIQGCVPLAMSKLCGTSQQLRERVERFGLWTAPAHSLHFVF